MIRTIHVPFTRSALDTATRSTTAVPANEQRTIIGDPTNRGGVIDEILLMGGVEFDEPVVLVDDHAPTRGKAGISNVLGSIREIRVRGDELIGRLRFASDKAGQDAWDKVQEGHVRDVSIGYEYIDFVDIPAGRTEVVDGVPYRAFNRRLRITRRWRLREVSLVAAGADPRAKIDTPGRSRASLASLAFRSFHAMSLSSDSPRGQSKAIAGQ